MIHQGDFLRKGVGKDGCVLWWPKERGGREENALRGFNP